MLPRIKICVFGVGFTWHQSMEKSDFLIARSSIVVADCVRLANHSSTISHFRCMRSGA
jgi:hypothetical protein